MGETTWEKHSFPGTSIVPWPRPVLEATKSWAGLGMRLTWYSTFEVTAFDFNQNVIQLVFLQITLSTFLQVYPELEILLTKSAKLYSEQEKYKSKSATKTHN